LKLKRWLTVPLVAVIAAVVVAVVTPGTAQAATYDGADPIATGCANTAITAKASNIYNEGVTVIGQIQLRYSTACRTVWARILAYDTPYQATGGVTRDTDLYTFYCHNPTWSSSLGAYSCFTKMLNDRNVTSYAYGYAAQYYGGTVFYNDTPSY